MQRCNPKSWVSRDETTDQPGLSLGWTQSVPGALFRHGVIVPTTGDIPTIPTDVILRIVCHILVNNMPDRGLPELFRCAADAYEFHAPEEWSYMNLLPGGTETVAAKVRAAYERPSFEVVEE
jgi:hypothetical protein